MADQLPKLTERFGVRYGIAKELVVKTLLSTAFKQRDGQDPTMEEMIALLVVAEQYKLNPFTREIYAFRNRGGGITPIIGVDGWVKLAQSARVDGQKVYDGHRIDYSEESIVIDGVEIPKWAECVVFRKDLTHEIRHRVYAKEFFQTSRGPWGQWPMQMLTNKAIVHGFRMAFGLSGLADIDEAQTFDQFQTPNGVTVLEPKPVAAKPAQATLQQPPRYVTLGKTRETYVSGVVEKFKASGLLDKALGYFKGPEQHFSDDDIAYANEVITKAQASAQPVNEPPAEETAEK